MTPRPLVIVGAGGFARETAELVRAADPDGRRFRLTGIVDDDPARAGTVVAGLPVLGPVETVRDHDAAIVVCVGNPANFVARAMIVDRLGLADDRYATLVHPAAVVPSTATLGAGTVVHAGVVFTTDVSIGNHVAVMPAVVLTHDDEVGDFVTFASGVRVGGGCRIGTGAYLGAGSVVRESADVGVVVPGGRGQRGARRRPVR